MSETAVLVGMTACKAAASPIFAHARCYDQQAMLGLGWALIAALVAGLFAAKLLARL